MKLKKLIALYEDESGKSIAVGYADGGKAIEGLDDIARRITGEAPAACFTGKPIEFIRQLAFNELWLKQEAELERILNGGGEQEKA